MLFTRENVMKRAAAHGLGYLTPTEALAWCKAAAKTEVVSNRREIEQDDSMVAVKSEDSDGEDWNNESPLDSVLEVQSDLRYTRDEERVNPKHANYTPGGYSSAAGAPGTDIQNANALTDGDIRGTKRQADSQWLKGSYISKRAGWDGPPVSTPTPMRDLLNRYPRRRQPSARTADSDKGQVQPISQPTSQSTTPWLYEAQQRGTPSRYSGSTAQGAELKDSKRHNQQQMEDLDELHEASRETTFVSAPDFRSGSQGKAIKIKSMDRSFSDSEPDELSTVSARDMPLNTPASKGFTSSAQRSGPGSNKLPKLPRSSENRAGIKLMEYDSFITEVAPSSRNLEKFQYRKKQRKSKKQQSSYQSSDDESESPSISLPRSIPAEIDQNYLSRESSVAIDAAPTSALNDITHENNRNPPTASCRTETRDATLPSWGEVTLVQKGSDESWDMMEDVVDDRTPNRNENEDELNHMPVLFPLSPNNHDLAPNSSKSDKDLPITSRSPQEFDELEGIPAPQPSSGQSRRSQATNKAGQIITDHSQAPFIDDGSTQSFNSLARVSLRSPQLPLADASSKPIADNHIIQHDEADNRLINLLRMRKSWRPLRKVANYRTERFRTRRRKSIP